MTVVDLEKDVPQDVPQDAPAPAAEAETPDVPRRIGGLTRSGVLSLFGAAASGLCTAILLFGELAPFSGTLGFFVTAYLSFLGIYAVLTGLEQDGQAVRDRVMTVVLWTAGGLMFCALAMVVGFTLWRGREALPHGNFFAQDMQAAGPLDPLTNGGIEHAMLGTLIMITIALAITVPLGLACAVYLNQIPGRFSRFVRTIVEAMTALPSIVAGLMVYAVWILGLGMQKSGLAAGFAISVMMLPIVIRASDVVLRLVPGTLTEASEALGAPRWRTVWHVVLPTARSGLATAVILGTARGIGETSPVLLTAGFTAALNADPTSGPMISLPLAVFNFVKSPEPTMIARGFGAAAVLMALVLVLFAIARVIGGRGPGHQNKRQAKRAARASRRDAQRFAELHTPGLQLFETGSPASNDETNPPRGAGNCAPSHDEPAPTDGEQPPSSTGDVH
ncbi:phosphate transport system permease protein [Streptomyces sp. Ag109_O5-1]|uniref:phosphate ABC transporter permease PstA n=1 Tax=Streptomyces sp. Ag109_O5-1 TaxID=1938851 RepID=UPI000F4E367D|nr:phosphate ABC transporter permease PstA [Streptomyces sp. Ag109_O5-1]RPE41750.1 phosphate transport system permease protein [Streptomyces sp. Ag109_O5-1]